MALRSKEFGLNFSTKEQVPLSKVKDHQEHQQCSGGILADEMGLGKYFIYNALNR